MERPLVTGADILAKARSYKGKFHDGPDVPRMAQAIGKTFPDLAEYSKQAKNDTKWCAIFTAYVLSQFGIRPPPVDDDGIGYMLVARWRNWGTPVPLGQERPGDLAIYPGHINFVAGGGKYVGGNQGNAVSEISYRKPDAIRRPPTTETKPVTGRFRECLARVLKHEGGNDDDPRDPGGRTSRGITAARWAEWRQTHPGLPADVWEAPQVEVEAIYREKYWDILQCDYLPYGVDYAVFDFGVNSGPSRSAKFLQEIVGSEADGEIGPNTIAATKEHDEDEVINKLCDNRLYFLKGLSTWATFGRGWTTRVEDVRRDAIADAQQFLDDDEGYIEPKPNPPEKPPETTSKSIDEALARIDAAVADIRRLADVATQPAPQMDWGRLLQPLLAELAPKIVPLILPYVIQMLPQLLPYILGGIFKPQQSVMSKPGVQAGAVGGLGAVLGALATHFLNK